MTECAKSKFLNDFFIFAKLKSEQKSFYTHNTSWCKFEFNLQRVKPTKSLKNENERNIKCNTVAGATKLHKTHREQKIMNTHTHFDVNNFCLPSASVFK